MSVVVAVLAVCGAYLVGTFPTAILIGVRSGHDPTSEGSGNPGASNVYRTAGRRAGALVLLGDLVKGAVAAGLGLALDGHQLATILGAAAVLGHVFPVTRGLRGGKGVATAAGMAIVAYPLVSIALALMWLVVAKLGRTASLASLAIAVGLPVGTIVVGRSAGEVAVVAFVAVLVIARHTENIRRLLARDEARLSAHDGPSGGPDPATSA